MLKRSSVLMMLLIATASLVGISSIYQPANVETQPQPLVKEPAKQFPGAGQYLADKFLVDRIFPKILAKIDGATLLQKIDRKLLAQKLLPHIQVNLRMGDNYGPLVKVKKDPLAADSYAMAEASCPPGTRVMGGGGQIAPYGNTDYSRAEVEVNNIVSLGPIPVSRFVLVGKMDTPGDLLAYATCLAGEATVSLKP